LCALAAGTMAEFVGATVLADSVISWAIGESLTMLAACARLAVHCKSKCAALADLLAGQQLRAVARDLDSLTQVQAFAQVRAQYDRLCEQLEEAQYLVLRCRQTGAWNAVTRVRIGRRIEAVHSALEATVKELAVNVPAALLQDTAIKEQLVHNAHAARNQASLLSRGDRTPLQIKRSAGQRAACLHEPNLPVVFQHLDALVPRLCAELPHHRVHGIVGMPGLGKTIVATAIYDRAKSTFQRHFFLTVGEQADVLSILRDVFGSLHPEKAVRRPTLLCPPVCSWHLVHPPRSLCTLFAFPFCFRSPASSRASAPRQAAQSHPKAVAKAKSRLLIFLYVIALCRCHLRRTRRMGASGSRGNCRPPK
jgi:NB-ARC domain